MYSEDRRDSSVRRDLQSKHKDLRSILELKSQVEVEVLIIAVLGKWGQVGP